MRCVIFLWLLRHAAGWRTFGVLPNLGSFTEYVGKFCFDFKKVPPGAPKPAVGSIEVLLRGRVASARPLRATQGPPCYGPCESDGGLYLFVFDDEQAHGQLVRQKFGQMSCEDMRHRANWALPIRFENSEQFLWKENITEGIRPRFWYFVFAACGVQMVVPPAFDIHATNILQGFQSEFGLDQEGTLLLQVTAAVGFLGLFLGIRQANQATGSEALRSRSLLRILLVSASMSSIGACCLCLHWSVFASDGEGLLALQVAGVGLLAGAKSLLAILQLLLAKGWALFYSPQQLLQRQVLMGAVLLIILLSVLCELHEVLFHDWSAQIYMYENWSGIIILMLNCCIFLEAWRSMRETFLLETSDEMRRFYVYVSGVSILYFLTLPLVCLLASMLARWVRAKYVDRAEVGCRFLATLLLAWLLRPARMDAMINARMEESVETLGEPCEEAQIIAASGSVPLRQGADRSPEAAQAPNSGLPQE
ncbi:unnamed protein product [Effrenium voratum]|uniref:GPR180/TMEM145 transmembrane domain-containing protein n=1 Tax=Effrenium voratum TaxID=2562239 RepID=A0AA36JE87_9DINO|nr:unnamed protein product [Effrenium voratum]